MDSAIRGQAPIMDQRGTTGVFANLGQMLSRFLPFFSKLSYLFRVMTGPPLVLVHHPLPRDVWTSSNRVDTPAVIASLS